MNKEIRKKKGEVGPLEFNGAAIINPDGSETPITNEMIEKACNDLEAPSEEEDETQH